MDCLFCKIINGDIPSYKIYEDDTVFVFMDINPTSNGHTLIIPKKHYTDVMDIDDNTLLHIFKIAREIKTKLEAKLHCDGITLTQNNGDAQEVKHYHLHIIPYYNETTAIKEVNDVYTQIMS